MARHFPNWIKAYLEHTKLSESPTSFHFWTAVSTVAGALRRRVWIDEHHFHWVPNFYIILVGPPGIATKSTSIGTGMRMLEKVKDVNFGPQSGTWQALTQSLERAIREIEVPDFDGQPYKIPMSCLTISIGELGTFFKMEDSAMMDVLVSLWDGQLTTWRHETKTTGDIEIKNPWLNIIGCTTPAWLQTHFPEAMIGGGLTSRILFVYGDTKRHLVAYPSQLIESSDYRLRENQLVEDLQDIGEMKGQFKLTREAITWGTEWYQKHWTSRPEHMASSRYGGYIARKQTHIHKLAMILAASKRSTLHIEAEDLMEASGLIEALEPDMAKVFESIGVPKEAGQMSEICTYVINYGALTTANLYRLVRNVMSMKDFELAVVAAVKAGELRYEKRDIGNVLVPTIRITKG